ncbi:MAG: glycosyltransferase family 4 protein [Chloroflexota bacterium]
MKIVFVSSCKLPSDTANSIQVMKVCQAFVQLGHKVTLLVPGPRSEAADLFGHYGLHTLFDIEWLPARSRRLFPWMANRRARALGADFLYAWPIQSAVLAPLMGIPSMLEIHDFPAGLFGPLWFRLFVALPGKKRLLPITDALRRVLEQKYGSMPEGKAIISPDGVDLERYALLPDPGLARRELGLPAAPSVLCTGHLYAGRGADIFLALAKKFTQASFVWVGGRPKDVEYWRAQAAQQLLTNVTFTGFVTNDRIPLYQAAADVLLMPYGRSISGSSGGDIANIYSPMKMFEYLASGRAILTADLPVLHEVLDETTAVFAAPGDVESWESALGGLLADEKRRRALGQRACSVAQRYTWVERARRVLEGFCD